MTKTLFDPGAMPVEGLAGEAPLAPDVLTAQAVRARFARTLPWDPEPSDEALAAPSLRLRRAAVLLPLVERPAGLSVLLTRRTEHLSSHAGQVSFPGGRAEELDSSPIETALRETEEEIGLHRRHVEIVGVLPEHVTISAYRVTPVVALVQPPFALRPDPGEVAEIFEVPLAFLMSGANHERRSVALPDGSGKRSFYAMPYQDYFIWGATAAMLRNLYHFLRA
ncbi:CoA pyrophosphatase [Massilia oculi]|uniref:CoA pyrophosphatase n=1 Tax=Massilia hydrophila TaxID=3044279 RepID=A0ABS7YGK2_9BURK|nr:CoA pyrophosphatase [Massilia oculi]MCA1858051.1 CoA pyrophosphatase [Massilia oculi]